MIQEKVVFCTRRPAFTVPKQQGCQFLPPEARYDPIGDPVTLEIEGEPPDVVRYRGIYFVRTEESFSNDVRVYRSASYVLVM